MSIKTLQGDCLAYLKGLADNSQMIIFCDPPYALGSDVIIRKDGKPDYRKAVDFMAKWEQPDGAFWEQWFNEAFRVLKYGGRVVMFGMDRQLMLNKYYACFAGFAEQQSLYWYFISNFPKASDLGKMLDKNAGAEREVVGTVKNNISERNYEVRGYEGGYSNNKDLTTPATTLAQKYDGMKYSIAPLKQTNETILVFQKPYKTGSCLHDTLAYENGDAECMCGAVDVEGNRCAASSEDLAEMKAKEHKNSFDIAKSNVNFLLKRDYETNPDGRYPAQTYCDDEAAKVLDTQSGILKSGEKKDTHKINKPLDENGNYQSPNGCYGKYKACNANSPASSVGCSRILHKCNYDDGDFDLYMYCPKVSGKERNEGCDGLEEKKIVQYQTGNGTSGKESSLSEGRNTAYRNTHPTVKPISLLKQVLQLFITPDGLDVLDPFMGSGSMGIAAVELDINYTGIELNPEYFEIADKRIQHAKNKREYSLF